MEGAALSLASLAFLASLRAFFFFFFFFFLLLVSSLSSLSELLSLELLDEDEGGGDSLCLARPLEAGSPRPGGAAGAMHEVEVEAALATPPSAEAFRGKLAAECRGA